MSELYYAEMVSSCNDVENKYFAARPHLRRTLEQQTLFRAGYDRAFNQLWSEKRALQRRIEVAMRMHESEPHNVMIHCILIPSVLTMPDAEFTAFCFAHPEYVT